MKWDEIEARHLRPSNTPKVQDLSPDSLRLAYDELASKFREKGKKAAEDFVRTNSSAYLDQFITANTLAITTKASKKVVEEGGSVTFC